MVKEKAIERYSFSRLSLFHTCRHGFYKKYIENLDGVSNCFSSYGLFLHSLLERYTNGKINLWDLPAIYEWEFDVAITETFPNTPYCPEMRKLYYEQGLAFIQDFPGYSKIKILEVESEFDFGIDDWVFNGIIDLVYEDFEGRIVIEDYKSKSGFKSNKEQREYARQLYLYALHVKEKYGRYPDILRFTMMRKQQAIDIPFNEKDLEEAVAWAKDTVCAIRGCWDYSPSPEEFFCNNLCNYRECCEHRFKKGNT